MSSIVILSSPPKTFARSPTPVDSSSPLPSTEAIFARQSSQNTSRKFRRANVERDGCGEFSSARTLLGTKIGAENLHIGSPKSYCGLKSLSPKRFKSSAATAKIGQLNSSCENENEDPIHDELTYGAPAASTKLPPTSGSLRRFNGAPSAGSSSHTSTTNPRNGLKIVRREPGDTATVDDPFELPSSPPDAGNDVSKSRKGDMPRARQAFSPLNIDMAVARRLGWTPTKDTTNNLGDDSPSVNLSRSFSASLMGSFSYNGDTAVITPASRHEIDTGPTKRRRLDMIDTNVPKAGRNMPPPKTAAVKKPKAPAKKTLTITGLATSNYFGQDDGDNEHTALDKFLATQAQDFEAKVKAVKKQRVSKKFPQKSTLVSPASAIKALENQDALFGSASQLARDESPSLTHGTLEAIKQPESYAFSSPLRTQDTGPISIESTTPRATTGISRFTKTRGLWAAAVRGEDNALLHVDTIDIDSFDTVDLRRAFPGKDVLVQPSDNRVRASKSPEKLSPFLRGRASSHRFNDNLWDIDNMETPIASTRIATLPKIQARTLHTTARARSLRKRSPTLPLESVEPALPTAPAPPTPKVTKRRTPNKPAFAGHTTEKLQKQIAAYGFKPMKNREQMIIVLEKCWIQKNAAVTAAPVVLAQAEPELAIVVDEPDDSLKHGDYLSNIHGLASRLVPKEKKVTKPREQKELKEPKEVKSQKKREPKAKAVKETETEDGPTAPKPKVVRKRKSEAALFEEKVVDIDDLDLEPVNGNVRSAEAAMALADATIAKVAARRAAPANGKATATVKAKAAAKTTVRKTTKKIAKAMVTSPDKVRAKSPAPMSSSGFATPFPLATEISATSSSSTIPITRSITHAIQSYVPPPGTNHQTYPTWHEKILLYDPIVLEDLALWLNTVGFAGVGEDREVSALEVRGWCEGRGICCLWRGGWRGSKGGDGE